jgi:hypothetical protein
VIAAYTGAGAEGGVVLWLRREDFDGHSQLTGRGMWLYGMGLYGIFAVLGVVAVIAFAVG